MPCWYASGNSKACCTTYYVPGISGSNIYSNGAAAAAAAKYYDGSKQNRTEAPHRPPLALLCTWMQLGLCILLRRRDRAALHCPCWYYDLGSCCAGIVGFKKRFRCLLEISCKFSVGLWKRKHLSWMILRLWTSFVWWNRLRPAFQRCFWIVDAVNTTVEPWVCSKYINL